MKNAVILARYSCEKQTELSIEGQLDVCYKYAKENDYNIIGEYIDRAESGRTDDREQFQNMMRDAALGTFEAVIVYKFDRFARNKVESVVNKNRLMKLGVKVISATQLIPDAPEGVIFESIIEAYDEYYSLELAQKILRSFRLKRMDGCSVGGKRTYGYDVSQDRKYVINEKEAEVIRLVFKKYLDGLTLSQIGHYLKEECIAELNYSQLANIIENTKYIGQLSLRGEVWDDVIPSIIDKDTFYAAQKLRGGHEKRRIYNRSTTTLRLANKCYCSTCGERLGTTFGYNKDHIRFYYYKCTNKECHLKPLNALKMEDSIFNKVIYQLSKNMVEIANKVVEQLLQEEDHSQIEELQSKRKDLERRKKNVLESLEHIGYEPSLQERLKELSTDIYLIDKKIAGLKKAKVSTNEIIDFINVLLARKDTELKNAILRDIVEKVEIDNEYIIVKCKTTQQESDGSSIQSLVQHQFKKSNILYTNYGFVLRISRCA